ncbi:hypothetical protein [Streptomyces californicus]|uniref:hypothetical protein n=1 Tax=Streptomyces californicus TaxID=67351 RepID=UPI0033E763D9
MAAVIGGFVGEGAGGVLAELDARPGCAQSLRAGSVRGGTELGVQSAKGVRLMHADEMAYDDIDLLV